MNFKYIKIYTIIILFILFFSCASSDNDKIDNKQKEIVKTKVDNLTSFQREWYEMKSKCNILVIKKFYLDPKTNVLRTFSGEIWKDSIDNVQKINQFRQLFTDSIDGGYCCCPFGHYSITFYKDTVKMGQYYIDTVDIDNKALFYDNNYQTSFRVDLGKWNEFLKRK
jgi:hypothetical protein